VDSLTVHYLARELDEAWRGRRVASFVLESRTRAALVGAAGSITVRFDLSRPECRVHRARQISDREPLDGYEITGVMAPVDDRRIVVQLIKPGKFRGSAARAADLSISLRPNARGAALVSDGGHRFGAVGAPLPAAVEPRPLLSGEELHAAAAAGDPHALLQGRWMSTVIAKWLLSEPRKVVERYERIAALEPARPARCDGLLLPFPFCDDAQAADSLIDVAPEPEGSPPSRASDSRDRAIAKMRIELERAAEAPRIRAAADGLMALAEGSALPASLTLPDGSPFALSARVGDTAASLAGRLYARARAMDRASSTLPARIAELEARTAQEVPVRRQGSAARAEPEEPRQPYRRYTSRGGLEIRVGKSAADNDALTFHASSPDDVWLHAGGASGSHVVLRWTQEGPPPAADLEEAAMLAAWHSRARGSAVVPVTWTRRRYVRKARRSAPGSVVVSRAETVFARPTAAAVRAIRDRG
jgi:hypothetical protein